MITKEEIASSIESVRSRFRISELKIAKEMGVDRSQLNRWKNGRTPRRSSELMIRQYFAKKASERSDEPLTKGNK